MFKKKTVFVVGAGASKELGMPLGFELAHEIANLCAYQHNEFGQLNGDRPFRTSVVKAFGIHNPEVDAARALICSGIRLVNSIDNFIDTHQGNKAVESTGKFAIAYSILIDEAKSGLAILPGEHFDPAKVAHSW